MGSLRYRLFAGFLALLSVLPFQYVQAQELSAGEVTHCCDPVTGICTPGTLSSTVTAAQAAQTPVHMDLSSDARTIMVPQTAQFTPVNIVVGDSTRAILPGAQLTPAEFVAAHQILSTGTQSILLGGGGTAVGGAFALSSALSQAIGNLVVPSGVTAVRDFGTSSALNISGNLVNAGNFYAISSNAAVTTAAITASNIMNHQAALISSVLPAGGLPGFTSAVSALNLNLNAINNIVNAGTILSSGTLTATAGGSIINALPSGVSGTAPVMQAMHAVNLNTANLTNAGLIASTVGNVNIAQQTVSNILLNNQSGTIQALLGAVNVRDASFMAKSDFSMSGGNVFSKEFNINGGEGKVNVEAGDISGTTNVRAGELIFGANSMASGFGNVHVTGDPLFHVLSGPLVLSNIVASGPTTIMGPSTVTVGNITHSGGGSLIILAGVNISPSGGNFVVSGYQSSPFNLTVGSITTDTSNLCLSASGSVLINGNIVTGASSGSSFFLVGSRQHSITLNGTVSLNPGTTMSFSEVYTALGGVSGTVNGTTGAFSGSVFSNPPISGSFTSNQANLASTFIGFTPNMNVGSQTFTGGGPGPGPEPIDSEGVLVLDSGIVSARPVVPFIVTTNQVAGAPTPNIIATDQDQLNDGVAWGRWTSGTVEFSDGSKLASNTIPGDIIGDKELAVQIFFPSNATSSGTTTTPGNQKYSMGSNGAVFVYSGANDGMLHGFGGGTSTTSGGGTATGTSGQYYHGGGSGGGGGGGTMYLKADGTGTATGTSGSGTGRIGQYNPAAAYGGGGGGGGGSIAIRSGSTSGGSSTSGTGAQGGAAGSAGAGAGSGVGGGMAAVGIAAAAVAAVVAEDTPWFIDTAGAAGSGADSASNKAAGTMWSNVPDEVSQSFMSTPGNQGSATADDLEAKKATMNRFIAYSASEFTTAANMLGAHNPVAVYIPDNVDIVSKALRAVQRPAKLHDDLPFYAALRQDMNDVPVLIAEAAPPQPVAAPVVTTSVSKRQKNLFLNPTKDDAVLSTKTGYILCKKGAMAFVMDRDRDIAVFALHQTRPGDIKMLVGKKMMTIRPGQEVVITKRQTDDFALANPGAKIPYRSVAMKEMDSGRRAFRAEFSVPAAITNIDPLKKMLKSADSTDRKKARSILKNAVILSQLNPEAGPFKTSR